MDLLPAFLTFVARLVILSFTRRHYYTRSMVVRVDPVTMGALPFPLALGETLHNESLFLFLAYN